MDDTQRIVKCGNLSLHSTGGFFKKRWHSKYLVLYDGSKSGVKRLELFDSEIKFKKQNPAKIIPLVDCVRVVTCQRNKTTYTFEVRTSDQFYLLAGQSFQDMNDWVNCLRLVAFGQQAPTIQSPAQLSNQQQHPASGPRQLPGANTSQTSSSGQQTPGSRGIDVLLEKRNLLATSGGRSTDHARPLDKIAGSGASAPLVPTDTHPALTGANQRVTTASQAAASAASALAKARQRQPSLLGSCKPQPPTDSPFIKATGGGGGGGQPSDPLAAIGQLDTLTPTVRGQLIAGATKTPLVMAAAAAAAAGAHQPQRLTSASVSKPPLIQTTLDEEEENMLYCSIEDNPSEHNYRVKVIETELSLRCQLKCYQLTGPTTISQQYEQLGQFNGAKGRFNDSEPAPPITFYQLIIGPQELTLLNDYAALTVKQQQQQAAGIQQQGLWSWPYQCIRRYGFDKDNCFMFEAGRKCTSGPGQFIVQTPKAYSIYQDVVKFVNELRSLSTTDAAISGALPSAAGNSNAKDNEIQQSATGRAQVQVTQIPVSWAPNAATGAIKVDTGEFRQQFFNTLRQLDSTAGQAPVEQTERGASFKAPAEQTSQSPTTKTSSTSSPAAMNNNNSSPTTKADNTITTTSQLPTTTNHQSSVSPVSSVDTLQSAKGSPSSSSSIPSQVGKGKSCNSVASTEETDESGYDQGDDSVDSNKSRFKMLGANSRKRQAQDPMSSASSTSSGGSPGHSVSRRSTGAFGVQSHNGQGLAKRPPLNTVSGCNQTSAVVSAAAQTKTNPKNLNTTQAQSKETAGISQNQKLLGMLVGGNLDQQEDFEANLIRDVYSEITKLHAKFAVARGSAEDSLSNNSSNEESTNSSEQSGPSEQGETANDSGMGGPNSEPMYSNLRIRRAKGTHRIADLDDDDDEDDEEENNRAFGVNKSSSYFNPSQHQNYQHQTDQLRHSNAPPSYVQNGGFDYLSLPRCGPVYPTILNPIPECGEVAQPVPKQVKHKSELSHAGGPQVVPGKGAASNSRTRQISPNPNRDKKDVRDLNQRNPTNQCSQISGLLKSKLPTNHYVINDVQYAKISRNVCSKYESCL